MFALIIGSTSYMNLTKGNIAATAASSVTTSTGGSHHLDLIKDSKHIVNLEHGATSTPEVQPVAFKATEEEKRESTSSRLPIDAFKLDNKEMALIIKSFHEILKHRRGKDYKPHSKRVCYKCGKPSHFIAKCPMSSESDRDDDKKGNKKEKKC
jgi:hypothetical protein